MRDEGGGILGLLLALIAIYVLIVLIGFILYGAAVYYSGRHLWIRLSRSYKLTSASALALVGLGLTMLALSLLMSSLIFLWILLFLGVAILIVELWALAKWLPYWINIRRQHHQLREYSNKLEAVAREQTALSRRVQQLEERYGRPLQEQAELGQIVEALCRRDAENLTIKCRRWQEEFRRLSDAELGRAKREALAFAKAQKQAEKRSLLTIKAGLLRLEELERLVGPQAETLKNNKRALERKAHEEQELRQKLAQAQRELARLEATYRAFRASRIVLD